MAELTGGGVRFRASTGLDVAEMSQHLGAAVVEATPGRYVIDAETSPALVAALGSWLAGAGATLDELRSGGSLEDAYVAIVGELAAADVPATPARRARGRRR
jgi:hypothetical protein